MWRPQHLQKTSLSICSALLAGALIASCSSSNSNPAGSGGNGDNGDTGGSNGNGDTGGTGGTGDTGGSGGNGDTGGSGGNMGGGDNMGGDGGMTGDTDPVVTTLQVPGGRDLFGLTYSASGKIYVSGTRDVEEEPVTALWRYEADGTLDVTFGDNGVSSQNIGAGDERSYDVVELANGNLVVHGLHNGQVYLLKFDAEGNLLQGPVFVELGWSEADLLALGELPNAGWPSDTPPGYTSWGIGIDSSGDEEKIVVFAAGAPKKLVIDPEDEDPPVQRTDGDRWVARVLASDFSADPSFNGGEAFTVDVEGANITDNARRGIVEADGTILSTGYTNFGEGNHVALMRLTPAGALDSSFGFGTITNHDGLTRFQPFSGTGAMAEAYSVIKTSTRYITTGYGRSNYGSVSVENDVVSFAVLPDSLDETWGDEGKYAIMSEDDPVAVAGTWNGGRQFRDNGRDLVLLADGRTLHVGCYNDYASVFMFRAQGGLDENYGDYGMIVFDAANEHTTHNKPFFKASLSPDGQHVASSSEGGLLAIFRVSAD